MRLDLFSPKVHSSIKFLVLNFFRFDSAVLDDCIIWSSAIRLDSFPDRVRRRWIMMRGKVGPQVDHGLDHRAVGLLIQQRERHFRPEEKQDVVGMRHAQVSGSPDAKEAGNEDCREFQRLTCQDIGEREGSVMSVQVVENSALGRQLSRIGAKLALRSICNTGV